MSKFISRKDLLSWLEGVSAQKDLVAPVQVEGRLLFRRTGDVSEIVLDYTNTDLSPREFFFPATETLFTVDKSNGRAELEPTQVERDTVIFGMRPCDAKGMAALALPYLQDPADSLFAQHRERTAIVGLSCLKACPECFCTSMGTGPDDAANVDILLTEAADGYMVEVMTDKGKALMPDSLLSEAKADKPAPAQVPLVPAEGISARLREAFDDIYWSRLADRCLHCNVCSYVCPTCYCFDIRDYSEKGGAVRVRTWESCQSPGFTKAAGGHNPRADKGTRLRQRFAHKLLYYPEEFGTSHCTGCGRCVKACPVNIDIREIIGDVQKLGKAN